LNKEIVYVILNKFYIQQRLKEEFLLQNPNDIFYEDKGSAEEQVKLNIEKADYSRDTCEKTPLKNNFKYLTDKRSAFSRGYSYNVLKFKPGLEGFEFNIGIIVWNKETNEIAFKFMEEKQQDLLISVMPNISFLKEVIRVNNMLFSNFKTISFLREFIITFNNGYPLTYYFDNALCSHIESHKDNKDSFSIESVLNDIYHSKIGSHFIED